MPHDKQKWAEKRKGKVRQFQDDNDSEHSEDMQSVADPDGGLWGLQPLFSSGSGTFLIEMVLVLSESDESEYVISNVVAKQRSCLELFEFQSKWPEHTRQVNEPFT